MGKFVEKTKTALVATASGGVGCGMGFVLAGFQLRDWDFSWNWEVAAGPLATLGASIIGISAASLAWLTGRAARKQEKEIHEENSQAQQERTLRERFISIVKLLTTEDLSTRTSGAYALAALADDWAAFHRDDPKLALQEQQVCLNILTAQLHDPIEDPSKKDLPAELTFFKGQVQSIILSRFGNQKDKKKGPWSNLRIDLRNCYLYNFRTEGIFNQLASFEHAKFVGETSFSDSTFNQLASFEHAIFMGETSFSDSTFNQPAFFEGAVFHKKSLFKKTKFNETSFFRKVKFHDDAIFTDAEFSRDVVFGFERDKDYADGAEFQKNAFFMTVNFLGEATQFLHCSFKDRAFFSGAHFHGRAMFYEAHFDKNPNFKKSLFRQGKESPDIQYIVNKFKVNIENEQLNIENFPENRSLSYEDLA